MPSETGRNRPIDMLFGFSAERPRARSARVAPAGDARPRDPAPHAPAGASDLDVGVDDLVDELCALLSGRVVRAKMPQGVDKRKKTVFIPAGAVEAAEKMARETGSSVNSLYYLMFLAGADAIDRAYRKVVDGDAGAGAGSGA